MNLDKKKYSLILSKNYEPLSVEGVKKTMKYLLNEQGKALDPETYNLFSFEQWIERYNVQIPESTVRTEKLWILIPDIVVLNRDAKQRRNRMHILSKRKVYDRDHNHCGYCNTKLNSTNRTIDHIVPISKGGAKFDYKNVVACCSECNGKKGNKLLSELGWELKTDVTNPSDSILALIPKNKWLPTWESFLPEMTTKAF